MNRKTGESEPLIRSGESLLVIIDMQERLVPAIAEKEKVVENVIRLARFSRILNIPVIVTEQQKLGSTLSEVRACLENPQPVSKLHFNCFGEEKFAQEVRKLGRKSVILTGIEAHICVAQTALFALSEYRVHVVGDAVSSRTLQNRDIALRRMEREGVTITSAEMFIYEILGKAGTDEFREVLKLVK